MSVSSTTNTMASVNRLGALPPELFNDIIEFYINSVHVAEASATRAVSRAFNQVINYCIIDHLPATSSNNGNITGQEKAMGEKVMSGYLPAFHRSPVRKACSHPLVTSIYNRVDALLRVEVNVDEAATKQRYIEDGILYMARGSKQAALKEMLHPNAIFLPRIPPQALMNLTCAAAVGSLPTVKQFLSTEGPPVWSLPLYLKNNEFALFSDPLQAAASNGHVEVLKFLLSTLEEDPDHFYHTDGLPFRIHGAMLAAIQSKHTATILTIVDFDKKHKLGLRLGRSFAARDCPKLCIRQAVKTGCIYTCCAVLSCIVDNHSTEQLHLTCTHEQSKLLSELILEGGLVISKLYAWKGMEIAIRDQYQDVIKVR